MKRVIKIVLLILYSNMIISTSAQTPDVLHNLIPPSPDASSLGRFGEHDVSLYTGTPNITIPLFEIKSGEVTVPVSISYNAKGIQVNDIASWVGLGWSLNVGGVVTRTVKGGYPDDYLAWYFSGPDGDYDEGDQIYFAGQFYKNELQGVYPPVSISNGRLDAEPDMFYYNMPEGSGKFFFDENKNIFKIPYTPLKIDYEWGHAIFGTYLPQTTFEKFIITSTKGVRYIFDVHEGTENYNYSFGGLYDILLARQKFVSSWYLSEIIDSKGINQVSFIYDSISTVTYDKFHTYSYGPTGIGSSCRCNGTNDIQKSISQQKILSMKKIKKIIFKEGYILFYTEHLRKDLDNDRALSKIELYNTNNELQKRFIFYYDYFSTTGCIDNTCRRLKLVSIIEEGNDGKRKPPFLFTYNKTQLPPRNSNSQDYWGYYNSNVIDLKPKIYVYPDLGQEMFSIFNQPPPSYNGNTYILSGSDRSCNPNDILAGTIERITYPTGGYSEFIFEPHEFFYLGRNRIGGGIRIKKIIDHAGTNSEKDKITNYYYTLEDTSKSSGNVVKIPTYAYMCDDESAAKSNSYSDLWDFYDKNIIRKSNNLGVLGSINGPNIGYSRVKVEQKGIGATVYCYTSTKDFQDIQPTVTYENFGYLVCTTDIERILNTSYYPFTQGTSQNSQRGNLIKKEYYNNDNQIVKRNTYTYTLIKDSTISLSYETYYGGAEETASAIKVYSAYQINSDVSVLTKTVEEDFIEPGNEQDKLQIIEEKTYNQDYLQVTNKRSKGSDNSEERILYKYSYDFALEGNIYQSMKNNNQISAPIEIVKIKDGSTINAKIIQFKKFNSCANGYLPYKVWNSVNGKTVQQSFFDGTNINVNYMKEISFYDLYDSLGNILQYHKKDDIITSFYWGYDNTYPVAKIEGLAYDSIPDMVKTELDKLDDNLSNSALQQVNNTIRENLPQNCFITTYTYKPLIGIKTMTDPNGKTTYYEYDTFGRLILIKDNKGNIIKNFKYNYKDQ